MYVAIRAHDAVQRATTGTDGSYTASMPAANRGYTVYVSPDAESGLAAADYGDVPCGYASPAINVQRHVAGIDLKLSRGHWITTGVRTSSGAAPAARMYATLAVYLPQYGRWCDATRNDRTILEPPDYQMERSFHAEGTYYLRAQGLDGDTTYPFTWYPSALTGTSATAIALTRDLIGADAKVVTLPAQTLSIAGRAKAFDIGVAVVQVVTQEAGRIEIVAEGYPQDWSTGDYSFNVAPGTYRVRISSTGAAPFYYHPKPATSFDAATPVTVTSANVTGIDILR